MASKGRLSLQEVLAATDVPPAGLVQRVVAEDVVEVGEPLGKGAEGADIVVLEAALDAGQLRAKGIAGEEERPHRRGGNPVVVVEPVHRVQLHGLRFDKPFRSQPRPLEAPEGGAVAAGPAAPQVLVGVDEDQQAMLSRLLDHLPHVVEVGLVIAAGARVLDRLPGDEETQGVEPPVGDTAQMLVGLGEGEGPPGEADIRPVPEVDAEMGGAVGRVRHLCASAEVHPAEEGVPAQPVEEPAVAGRIAVLRRLPTHLPAYPSLPGELQSLFRWFPRSYHSLRSDVKTVRGRCCSAC